MRAVIPSHITPRTTALKPLYLLILCWSFLVPHLAQATDTPIEFTTRRIDELKINLINPTSDPAYNRKFIDQIRTKLALFPGDHISQEKLDFALIQLKNNPDLSDLSYSLETGVYGGVNIILSLHIKSNITAQTASLTADNTTKFPVLYHQDGKFLKAKFEALGLYYANQNAWYGNPQAMLAGNPLVDGKSAGQGYDDWVENYIHGGLYGMYPLSTNTYGYAGISAIGSFSNGQELFTNKTRSYLAFEDAYIGFVTGTTTTKGNRAVLNLSAGRERFTLGDGMLIINTAANGGERAALQSNARWSADFVAKAQIQYNRHRLEFFRVDPSELSILDTKTVINGINLQTNIARADLGFSYLKVAKSNAYYYLPTHEKYTRQGLNVWDIRAHWNKTPTHQGGIFLAGEYAQQTHENFAMKAQAYNAELGYRWPMAKWSPSFSYRYAKFTGDQPDTKRYERWDPLFSGGNGEQWV
ncbi:MULTISPECIES: alginate export family protein [unclassified Acinetobacter]|uniref:alginate export family protein n=1 Tax=unclassified Acinetobacter TaxID=196816 RepID=UPI002934611A|nr:MULTISPECIES: alginate export family protein [unclassified Acinetobacter]WOE31658.1 alginate export family protein [Acinetobacter sp. SAAs470]WOE37123.1 alginate export family protein [Acinetobacter sp. SAAs474]